MCTLRSNNMALQHVPCLPLLFVSSSLCTHQPPPLENLLSCLLSYLLQVFQRRQHCTPPTPKVNCPSVSCSTLSIIA